MSRLINDQSDLLNPSRSLLRMTVKILRHGVNYFTRTSFIMRPDTFQSWTYRLPSLSQ